MLIAFMLKTVLHIKISHKKAEIKLIAKFLSVFGKGIYLADFFAIILFTVSKRGKTKWQGK